MARRVRGYECMYIVDPELSDEEIQGIMKRVEEYATYREGEVTEHRVWDRRRHLTYPIQRKKEGCYVLFSFLLPAERANEFKEALRLDQQIMRFMVVCIEEERG